MASGATDPAPSSSSQPGQTDLQMVDNSLFLHGREESLGLVETLDGQARQSLEEISDSHVRDAPRLDSQSSSSQHVHAVPSSGCKLLDLPAELIDHIISFLGPFDLLPLSLTCRRLSGPSRSDLVWQPLVQENVPGVNITSPFPCSTFRELYRRHDPFWFVSKYKIWFSDYFLTGKLIIARYDPRRAVIEGYRLVAERSPPAFDPWEADDQVLVHSFDPHCQLHLDQPILRLEALALDQRMTEVTTTDPASRFSAETSMLINDDNHRNAVFSNFLLTKPVPQSLVHPSMQLWPPPTVPARHRVRNSSQEAFVGSGHKPHARSEICDQAFRIRRWMLMAGGRYQPAVHVGEEVYTYATLDPKLYTPTEEKPWRGIWVGDFSGHGCEFLLVHQPDNETPFDEAGVVRADDETIEEWEVRKREERLYRGRLEAVKLTGDPNVPRGEVTFVADDISKAGYVRTATEQRFKGARIVKSRGHVAANMFRNDKYIESQLIMISHDKLAQYWVGFGHISFYERVDIDKFICP